MTLLSPHRRFLRRRALREATGDAAAGTAVVPDVAGHDSSGQSATRDEHEAQPAPVRDGTDAEPATPDALVRGFLLTLGVFAVSRLCVVAAAAVRATQVTVDWRTREGLIEEGLLDPAALTAGTDDEVLEGPLSLMTGVFTSWDGLWYLRIVRDGYPVSIPSEITYHDLEARAAFFPGYPLLTRMVDTVLPGGDVLAALALNVVLSVVAIWLLGRLAMRWFDVQVATRAMMLFAIFPGSFVLSYAYAEPLFIVLALATLLMLDDERWVAAGIFAALGTATRPNGVALVAACAVASYLAIRRRRDWSSLVAPLFAPIGMAAFHVYLGFHSGEWGAWFRVQTEAWEEGTSFGATAVTNTLDFVTNPFSSPTDAITALTMACMVFMLWCLWRRPLPWPAVAFVAIILVLMLAPATVTARPRFLFTAFPLFIAVAAWWPRRDRYGWDLTLLACGGGLAALTGLYSVFGVIP